MSFNSINRQFKTLDEFAAWLATLPPPAWHPVGSTYHNTLIPTLAQWRGLTSMRNMQATYEAKGWTSGPCLYVALGAPNPADDGIFVMTPPQYPGTHSPSCNSGAHGRFGVEFVGDYQNKTPTPAHQDLGIGAIAALHRYAGIGPDLNAHRDCDPRTCPGDAFYAIKPQMQAKLAAALNGAGLYRVRHAQAVFESPEPGAKVALNDTAELHAGDVVDLDEVAHGGWGHLRNGLGFVPSGVLTRVS